MYYFNKYHLGNNFNPIHRSTCQRWVLRINLKLATYNFALNTKDEHVYK